MNTHNSEEKDKAVAALIELAVKGAVSGALQNAEGAPLADTLEKASRATAHVMNLCVAAELIAANVRAVWPVVDGPLAGQFRACTDDYFDYMESESPQLVHTEKPGIIKLNAQVYRYRLRMYDRGTYCWTCRS